MSAAEKLGERMLSISDDDHLEISCCLERIRAIADIVRSHDGSGEMSLECGLMKHTLCGLAMTVIEQVEAADKLLDSVQ